MLVDFALDSILYGCNAGVNAIHPQSSAGFKGVLELLSLCGSQHRNLPTLSSNYE